MSPTPVVFLALVMLAVAGGVREVWRPDMSGALSSLSIAFLMAALLTGGVALQVLTVLGVMTFVWWGVRQVLGRKQAGSKPSS